MKKVFSLTVAAMIMAFAVSAFAADKTIKFTTPVSVNGQKLAAGEYKVRYQESGSTADVHFLKDKKEVATASAQMTELATTPRQDAVVTGASDGEASKLLQLQFANKKSAITFERADSSAGK